MLALVALQVGITRFEICLVRHYFVILRLSEGLAYMKCQPMLEILFYSPASTKQLLALLVRMNSYVVASPWTTLLLGMEMQETLHPLYSSLSTLLMFYADIIVL